MVIYGYNFHQTWDITKLDVHPDDIDIDDDGAVFDVPYEDEDFEWHVKFSVIKKELIAILSQDLRDVRERLKYTRQLRKP